MGILKILAKRRKARRPELSASGSGEDKGPKNGPLTLALVASLAIMVGLGILNLRLVRDASLEGKLFAPPSPLATIPHPVDQISHSSNPSEKQTCEVRPQLSFYSRLTAPEEQPAARVGADPAQGRPADSSPPSPEEKTAAATTQKMTKHEASSAISTSPQPTQVADSRVGVVDLPGARNANKRYTVQVGAFSSPAVAQQWAVTWKERGYNVLLKPVARPDTGVIHRLYLGSFSSEKKADELAKRLNTKEGIKAFRVMVRN